MRRIFLTHPPEALSVQYGQRAVARLQSLADVRFNTSGRELSQSELIDAASDCELIVSYRQTPATCELFRKSPSLIAFLRCAVDIRNIDVECASDEGVLVTHASAAFVPAVTEWLIAVMVNLSREIVEYAVTYHDGKVPSPRQGRELNGSTVGVIGYGRIARAFCDLCLALGMRVLVNDPLQKIENPAIVQTSFDELLQEADYVVPLAIANAQTDNMFDFAAFSRMKQGVFFINASRGNLVDEAALERALNEGRVAACALDVGRDPDQMPTPRLAAHARVIATPHIAALTPQTIERQALDTVTQVGDILRGRVPIGAINADRASRLSRLRST